MRTVKEALAVLLAVIMLFTAFPLQSAAKEPAATVTLTVESTNARIGSTVDVQITIQNNPGILGATLALRYDDELTLTAATAGDAFSPLSLTKPGQFASPCQFVWDGEELNVEDIKDGCILTLTFQVADDVASGSELPIRISYVPGDLIDKDLNIVSADIINGIITVLDFTPGDVNDDGYLNPTDIISLRRYISGGYGQVINESAADVNDDGRLNTMDIILIRRYLAGGYGVTLLASHGICAHSLEEFAAVPASCTESGNIAYWHCTICDRYYSDANCTKMLSGLSETILPAGHSLDHVEAAEARCEADGNVEYWRCKKCGMLFSDSAATATILQEQTVLSRLNHPLEYRIVDQAVAPTYTSTGLSEGMHCSLCGKILEQQQVLPVLDNTQYAITYKNLKGAENNNNPTCYWSENGVPAFEKPEDARGYQFDGWFTEEKGGTRITGIQPGTTGEVVLYAHWKLIEYHITYECFDWAINPSENPTTYTVESCINLLDGISKDRFRQFSCWRNAHSQIVTSLENSIGDIVLTAMYEWGQMRNLVTPYSALAYPAYQAHTCFDDAEHQTVYFTYYLGRVENIVIGSSYSKVYTGTSQETFKLKASTANSSTIAQSVTSTVSDTDSWQQSFSSSFSDTVSATISATAEAEYLGMKASVSAAVSGSSTSTSGQSESWVESHSVTNSNATTESFNVSSEETMEEEKTWDQFTPTGYYRLDRVCSADVFAVVIYNVETNSFCVETFNVVNDDIMSLWEYSADGRFIVPPIELDFVIPMDELTNEIIEILEQRSENIAVSFDAENHQICIGLSALQENGSLSSAFFPWLKDGIFTVYPNVGNVAIDSVKIVGAHDHYESLIDALSLQISKLYDFDSINVSLSNVGLYTANENGLILPPSGAFMNVRLSYEGTNTIRAHNGTAEAPKQAALHANNLDIISADSGSDLVLYGGDGKDATVAGGSGDNGSPAIICDTLTVDTAGAVSFVSGNGGNGCDGLNGLPGVTSNSYKLIDKWTNFLGIHIASIYQYDKATDGEAGQAGGNGGDAGNPIEGTQITIHSGTVSIVFGNGGNGGNGGDGGAGGKGHNYSYESGGIAFLTSYHPGAGGNGGNGGAGGHGGTSVSKAYSLETENVVIHSGTNGTDGTGGKGGAAGQGGAGGTGDAGAGVTDTIGNAPNGNPGNPG